MSLCHSWFGRDLSKNRGLAGFFTRLDLAFLVSPSSASVLWTLVALAETRKNRLSTSVIRRGPYSGCFFFMPKICCLTDSFSLGFAPLRGLATKPRTISALKKHPHCQIWNEQPLVWKKFVLFGSLMSCYSIYYCDYDEDQKTGAIQHKEPWSRWKAWMFSYQVTVLL